MSATWAIASAPDSLRLAADSLNILTLDPVEVKGEPLRLPMEGAAVKLGALRIRDAGGASLADLGPLLPSTRMSVNSRGEALFMLRGASERHLPVYLDGFPLSLPWDERVDLSMLPTFALGSVSLRRGMRSSLQGAGALAGRVDLASLEREELRGNPNFEWRLGEAATMNLSAGTMKRVGRHELLAALSHRRRDAWPLPEAYEAPFNQEPGLSRTASDLKQTSFFLRMAPAAGEGGWSYLLLGMLGEKGVPPETHTSDARYWRIPRHQRMLLGAKREGATGAWRRTLHLSLDLFGQEIRPYEDASYEAEGPVAGQDYETDRDFTSFTSLDLERRLTGTKSLGLISSLRYARHKESLTWYGDWTATSQILLSTTAELRGGNVWQYRLGAGYERSEMPETGDADSRPGIGAGVLQAGLIGNPSPASEVRISASRRSRFPSMREMFSTALGKFHPNNELGPESQNLLEMECSIRLERWEAALGVFASVLEGGIEKIPYEGEAKYQRVNRDEIRTLGAEVLLGWRPRPGLRLEAQHSQFRTRVKQSGEAESFAEDRPEFLSLLTLSWTGPRGTRLRLDTMATGPRYGAHPEEGLRRIPAQGSASLRLGRAFHLGRGFPGSDLEIFLRVDNLFDTILLSQIGLPESGRLFQMGFNLALAD